MAMYFGQMVGAHPFRITHKSNDKYLQVLQPATWTLAKPCPPEQPFGWPTTNLVRAVAYFKLKLLFLPLTPFTLCNYYY